MINKCCGLCSSGRILLFVSVSRKATNQKCYTLGSLWPYYRWNVSDVTCLKNACTEENLHINVSIKKVCNYFNINCSNSFVMQRREIWNSFPSRFRFCCSRGWCAVQSVRHSLRRYGYFHSAIIVSRHTTRSQHSVTADPVGYVFNFLFFSWEPRMWRKWIWTDP